MYSSSASGFPGAGIWKWHGIRLIPCPCLLKQCTTHGFEFFDFVSEDFFCELIMISQAGDAIKPVCSPIDHFSGKRNIIFFKSSTTANAAKEISHGQAPPCRYKASYRVLQLSD